MLKKLQEKWNVGPVRLLLILVCFATGGSLCGWAGRKILELLQLPKGILWVTCYIIIITILWPLCVIMVSIPLGQFSFFRNYLYRIFNRMRGKKIAKPARLAIFASGAGSNAEKIIQYFINHNETTDIKISLIVSNKPHAGVVAIAKKYKIPVLHITKINFYDGDHYLPALKQSGITHIILAGFLWMVPPQLIKLYYGRILNIHPALLPKYGGAGMYGANVHKAVIAAGEKESGITIHEVDEIYDHGKIIFQDICTVSVPDTHETLAGKIHLLEHKHFPRVIHEWVAGKYK